VGKISRALDKYNSERKGAPAAVKVRPASSLTHADILALVGYDPESGHLIPCDPQTGLVDESRIEALRAEGTILRLLENELIYPGGKLTARGVEEARRLSPVAAVIPRRLEVEPDERLLLAKAQRRAAERAVHAQPLPDSNQRPAETLLPVHETDDELIEAYSTPPPVPSLEREPAVQPAALQVAAAMPRAAAAPTPALPAAAPKEVVRPVAEPQWDEAAIDPNLVALTDPQSHEAEQFKILRTNILFPLAGTPPRSILVTSSAPGEGKTFAATNLAVSIALNINRHVLLIDADLRQPMVHKRFGYGSVPGLSTYLAEGVPLPGLLLKTKVEKLTLLPAGPPPHNPAELIGAERMSSLLAEVTSRYPDRIVVIDTPPPALAAETSVLARQVDGILLVVRYEKTRRNDLADTVAQLGEKKILGSIVNCIETAASRYYGYKYGGSNRPSKR
jgi:exopolysaccharide/PEP-CTERM locus tyrosine autokinase